MSYKRLVTLYKSHSHQNAGAPPPLGWCLFTRPGGWREKLSIYVFRFEKGGGFERWEKLKKNGERGRRRTDEDGDDEGRGRRQRGVTGRESLRNTPNKAASGEGGGSNLCLTRGEEGWESLDLTAHTHTHTQSHAHTHTHTDAFPCKQLGHAGRLGGRM